MAIAAATLTGMLVIQLVVFVAGLLLVLRALLSAVRTFVVPRGAYDNLSSFEFRVVGRIFNGIARPSLGYDRRDAIMALYAPIALVVLPLLLLALVLAGFAGMFWAIGPTTIEAAARDSGSALLTLGFAPVTGWPALVLSFGEAAIGLILVALLIAYLPTMYTAFQRREAFVAKVSVRAGTPASGTELLIRFWSVGLLGALGDLWAEAETWFIDLEESHTTLAALPFYRSPRSTRSWTTAAGCAPRWGVPAPLDDRCPGRRPNRSRDHRGLHDPRCHRRLLPALNDRPPGPGGRSDPGARGPSSMRPSRSWPEPACR